MGILLWQTKVFGVLCRLPRKERNGGSYEGTGKIVKGNNVSRCGVYPNPFLVF